MIELKLYLSDVDYESALKLLASRNIPGINAIAMGARALPNGAKEDLAVKFINANAGKIQEKIEKTAAKKGVRVKVSGAQATVVKK